jgi:hypothetical protein
MPPLDVTLFTDPACRAVVAAREHVPDLAEALRRALQAEADEHPAGADSYWTA